LNNITDRELEIFARLLRMEKLYDDSNPDVGMGPTLGTLLDRSGFELSQEDKKKVIKRYQEKYNE